MISYAGLNERLKTAGLKKSALSAALGISSRTIAKIAKREKLSKKTLEKIAAHLGCGVDDLCREISDNTILQILTGSTETVLSFRRDIAHRECMRQWQTEDIFRLKIF